MIHVRVALVSDATVADLKAAITQLGGKYVLEYTKRVEHVLGFPNEKRGDAESLFRQANMIASWNWNVDEEGNIRRRSLLG